MEIVVRPPGEAAWRGRRARCALGRTGVVPLAAKREGDGATPAGVFALRRVLYRADRLAAPTTALPLVALAESDGWCDDPGDANYNRAVTLPYPAGHELLWRDDGVYDVVCVIGHNDDPPTPGRGSAIFLHVARPDFAATQGCVALALADLLDLLRLCDARTRLHIIEA